MKKLFWLSVVIAILAAFFASTHPDGLDFIAEKFGFAQKGQERSAPMTDYSVGFIPEGGLSTSTAGVAGILITLGLFWLVAYIIKKGDNLNSKATCLLLLFLCLASPSLAARPLITDDFYTVTTGGYELEFGYASTQYQAATADGLDLSLKRGFLPQLDLGLEVPYTTSSPSGLNDIYLHAKYRLWQQNDNEGLTGRVDFKFNNGIVSQGLGSGDNDYCLMLIYSKLVGITKIHLNAGHIKQGINGGVQSKDYFGFSGAMEYPAWGERGDLVAEYVANSAAAPGPAFIQFGARYVIVNGFKLDAGYSFGLNSNSIKNNFTAGCHWEF